MRTAAISRVTAETNIKLTLGLDGTGVSQINTGVGFFDHMLTLFARHGLFDLSVKCSGDLDVDAHHTVEDVGICLGEAFSKALGDKRGISRYGDAIVPMDEALILTAADISGRGMLCWQVDIPSERVGSFDTELGEEFWQAFARTAGVTMHIRSLAGRNSHHILEGCFKSAARAMRKACEKDPRCADAVPSTKGTL